MTDKKPKSGVFQKMKKSLSITRSGSFTTQKSGDSSSMQSMSNYATPAEGSSFESLLPPSSGLTSQGGSPSRSDAGSFGDDRLHSLDVKVRDLEAERSRLSKLTQIMDAELQAARKTSESLEAQLKELVKKGQDTTLMSEAQRNSNERIHQELSQSLAAAEDHNLKLKRSLAARDLEISEVQAALKQTSTALDDARATLEKVTATHEQEVSALRAAFDKKADMLEKAVKAQESAAAAAALKSQADVNRLNTRIAHLQDDLTSKESELQQATSQLQRLEIELASQCEVLAQDEEKLKAAFKDLDEAKKGLTDLTASLKEQEQQKALSEAVARATMEKLEEEATKAGDLADKLKVELEGAVQERDIALEAQQALEQRIQQLESENAALHNELALDAISLDNDSNPIAPPESMLSNFGGFHKHNTTNMDNNNNTLSSPAKSGAGGGGLESPNSSSVLGPADGTITIGAAIAPSSADKTTAKTKNTVSKLQGEGEENVEEGHDEHDRNSFILPAATAAGGYGAVTGGKMGLISSKAAAASKHPQELLLKKPLPRMDSFTGSKGGKLEKTGRSSSISGMSPRKWILHGTLAVVGVVLASHVMRGGKNSTEEWEG